MKYLNQIFIGFKWLTFKLSRPAKVVVFISLILFIGLLYSQVSVSDLENPEIYFLDVGQGDSQLVRFPGGVDVLIDGGPPNGRAVRKLSNILGPSDRYIDLVVLTHPQTDHFGGLIDVFASYNVGAFLYGGRAGTAKSLSEIEDLLQKHRIPSLVIDNGDKILYGESVFSVLLPNKDTIESGDLNDASVVTKLDSGTQSILFTGDIGSEVESIIGGVDIDVLKVPHHGSKYSSSLDFLRRTTPKVSVIQVGGNSYGHPTQEVLDRLGSVGSKVFRTDKNGTIKLELGSESVNVFSDK